MTMHWRVEDLPGRGRTVFVSGSITEADDFAPLAALGGAEALRLDLAGVAVLNSCGVRGWVHFVRLLTSLGRPFELARCSPAIVQQLNAISNFCAGGSVRSVMLPYYCERCGREEYVEFELPVAGAVDAIAAATGCPACGGPAEFDDLPGSYLSFTKYVAVPREAGSTRHAD